MFYFLPLNTTYIYYYGNAGKSIAALFNGMYTTLALQEYEIFSRKVKCQKYVCPSKPRRADAWTGRGRATCRNGQHRVGKRHEFTDCRLAPAEPHRGDPGPSPFDLDCPVGGVAVGDQHRRARPARLAAGVSGRLRDRAVGFVALSPDLRARAVDRRAALGPLWSPTGDPMGPRRIRHRFGDVRVGALYRGLDHGPRGAGAGRLGRHRAGPRDRTRSA